MNATVDQIAEWAEKLYVSLNVNKKTAEEDIYSIMIATNNVDRQAIKLVYQEGYEKKLSKDIKKALTGNFMKLCLCMFYSPIEYDAKQLHRAMKFIIQDDEAFFEILVSRPKDIFDEIKEKHNELYSKDLMQEIESYIPSDLRRIIVCLLTTERDENEFVNIDDCIADAKSLIDTPFKQWISNIDLFNRVFVITSPTALVYIARSYYEKTGKTLLNAIDREFSGKTKALLRAILYANINTAEWFAHKINKAVKGLGTDTNLLNRCIVTRMDMDLCLVKDFYNYLYKETMKNAIEGDTTGIYQRLLLDLIETQVQE